jgi:hypothetical protein
MLVLAGAITVFGAVMGTVEALTSGPRVNIRVTTEEGWLIKKTSVVMTTSTSTNTHTTWAVMGWGEGLAWQRDR